MKYNDLTREQKKGLNTLITLCVIILVSVVTYLSTILSIEYKIQEIVRIDFKSAKVKQYSEDYLVIHASEYLTDEERLLKLKNILSNLSEMELDNSQLIIKFYDDKWQNVTRTITVGMSTLYNTDWSKKMTYSEFKEIINY